MRKKYEFGPVTGEGRNKTTARQDAECQAIEALERVEHGGWIAAPPPMCSEIRALTVHPGLHSWGYSILWADDNDVKRGATCSGYRSFRDAINACVRHALQSADFNAVESEEFASSVAEWFRAVLPYPDDGVEILKELRAYWGFQRCYAANKKAGLTDTECHGAACRDEWPKEVKS